ncbi:hypothetical protein BKA61DRAFT_488866, partial [Leptodontidium sp. MPI-SDFR-AT-0119]
IKRTLISLPILGVIHTGSTLTHFETPSRTIETVEGFSPAFKATVGFGADWLTFDPDKKHGRISLKAMAKTEDGKNISFGYTGIIDMTEDVWKIFNMDPEMKTVDFGLAVGAYEFTVEDPELKDLENGMWASCGRLIVGETGIQVENRISKVFYDRSV